MTLTDLEHAVATARSSPAAQAEIVRPEARTGRIIVEYRGILRVYPDRPSAPGGLLPPPPFPPPGVIVATVDLNGDVEMAP